MRYKEEVAGGLIVLAFTAAVVSEDVQAWDDADGERGPGGDRVELHVGHATGRPDTALDQRRLRPPANAVESVTLIAHPRRRHPDATLGGAGARKKTISNVGDGFHAISPRKPDCSVTIPDTIRPDGLAGWKEATPQVTTGLRVVERPPFGPPERPPG
ncbi:MAG: hypothetical protein V3U39_06625 [Acidimicrobiia bacterium]